MWTELVQLVGKRMLVFALVEPDWAVFYNSVVLTAILITQVYLNVAIAMAQHRQFKERKKELKKQLEMAQAQAESGKEGHIEYH